MQLLEVMVGFGIAGTGFGVILAVVGRAASDENRSMALGIATAAGSAGQVIGAPLAEWLMTFYSWQGVFIVFAGVILASLAILPIMRAPPRTASPGSELGMGAALMQAFRDPSFTLIFLGFFSCGYQLAFITAHFPAFVTEMCGPIMPGGTLEMLGITTTSALGAVCDRHNRACPTYSEHSLPPGQESTIRRNSSSQGSTRRVPSSPQLSSSIRSPPETVLIFSVLMGALWLATVPLTSGLIAQIYGIRYMGTLYSIVFLSHQLGGFSRSLAGWTALRYPWRLYPGLVGRHRRGRLLGAGPPADLRATAQ